MIGNDLVDLQQALKDSNWQRKGYLDKIYTPLEKKTILQCGNSTQMVWTLWSMKEAVYKIHSRKTGLRNFAPTSLVCTHINLHGDTNSGIVCIDTIDYYTITKIRDSYIHTLAATSPLAVSTIREVIYEYPLPLLDYKSTNPKCVSHHGRYLALIY